MADTGLVAGYAAINSDRDGKAGWNNTVNATAGSLSSYASCDVGKNTYGDYLVVRNYGFSVPSNATILGISAVLRCYGNNGNICDSILKLQKEGSLVGSNLASSSAWPTSVGERNYGGSTNLWGTTWTPADINSTTFGIALSPLNTNGSNTRTAYVDQISLCVYYRVPVAVSAGPITAVVSVTSSQKVSVSRTAGVLSRTATLSGVQRVDKKVLASPLSVVALDTGSFKVSVARTSSPLAATTLLAAGCRASVRVTATVLSSTVVGAATSKVVVSKVATPLTTAAQMVGSSKFSVRRPASPLAAQSSLSGAKAYRVSPVALSVHSTCTGKQFVKVTRSAAAFVAIVSASAGQKVSVSRPGAGLAVGCAVSGVARVSVKRINLALPVYGMVAASHKIGVRRTAAALSVNHSASGDVRISYGALAVAQPVCVYSYASGQSKISARPVTTTLRTSEQVDGISYIKRILLPSPLTIGASLSGKAVASVRKISGVLTCADVLYGNQKIVVDHLAQPWGTKNQASGIAYIKRFITSPTLTIASKITGSGFVSRLLLAGLLCGTTTVAGKCAVSVNRTAQPLSYYDTLASTVAGSSAAVTAQPVVRTTLFCPSARAVCSVRRGASALECKNLLDALCSSSVHESALIAYSLSLAGESSSVKVVGVEAAPLCSGAVLLGNKVSVVYVQAGPASTVHNLDKKQAISVRNLVGPWSTYCVICGNKRANNVAVGRLVARIEGDTPAVAFSAAYTGIGEPVLFTAKAPSIEYTSTMPYLLADNGAPALIAIGDGPRIIFTAE